MPAPGVSTSKTQQRAFSAPWQTTHPGAGHQMEGRESQKSFLGPQKWASPFSRLGIQKEAEADILQHSHKGSQGSQQIASKLLQNFQMASAMPNPFTVASPEYLCGEGDQSVQIQEKLDVLTRRIEDLARQIEREEKDRAARANVLQQSLMARLESRVARQLANHAFLDGVAKRVCHHMRDDGAQDPLMSSRQRKKQRLMIPSLESTCSCNL